MTSIFSNPLSFRQPKMKSVVKNMKSISILPAEKLIQVDRLLTNVVGEKEYTARLQYTKHLTECPPHLFFREVNDRVEGDDTGDGLLFKFEIKDIPFSEVDLRMNGSVPVPVSFPTDPSPEISMPRSFRYFAV